jgi:hypothetical protein
MPPLFPSKQSSLDSSRAGRREPFDLVESWKVRLLSRLQRSAELAGPKPRLIVRVEPRLVVFAAAFGVAAGPLGAVRSLVLVLSVLLVHELSRAMLARSKERRDKLWSTYAWAGIGARDPFVAHAALQQLPVDRIDLPLLAAYLLCCNRNLESQQLLLEARALGQRSRETSKLLIEVLFAQGDREGALTVATEDAALLTEQDRRAASLALTVREESQS